MRKLISYFIKYEVAVNIVILSFVIFGLVGAFSLNSSFFPLSDSKNILISVVYPGASPQEIEEGVVLKIEDNLKGLQGIDRVTSTSRENSGTINVEIEKGRDIDFMLLEVKNAVDRVPNYPTSMEPLVVAKQEVVRQTISFAISGDDIPLSVLKQVGRQVENDLRAIEGISQIAITGYPEEEIEIALIEDQLLAYDISFSEVAQKIAASNLLITGGTVKADAEEYLIRANNRQYYADELSTIVIKGLPDGRMLRLSDVATVRDRFAESPNATYFDGERAITVTITSTNTEDLIGAAEAVKEYIDVFNQKASNVKLTVVNDLSTTLTQRTELLTENAIMGMILVLVFLSLFLNTRLAFWVAFGLPVAFLGMFVVAPFAGVTINVLSLFGMIIVIGILVDDGIVIAENIYQHHEKGKSPVQAAIEGTLEVIPPIVSAILTTILAFGILLFLDGRIGEFFSEVSVIVILTLVVSLVEALIILPSHLAHSKALKPQQEPKTLIGKGFAKMRVINQMGDRAMVWMRDQLYTPFLKFALKNSFFTFAIFLALLISTFGFIGGGIIQTTFFPRVASDQVSINLQMPNGTNEKVTDSIIRLIEEKSLIANEEFTATYLEGTGKQLFENIILRLGPGSSTASLQINLLPGEERPDAIKANLITTRIRELVGPVAGVESLVYGSGGNFGGSPVSVSLLGNNIQELKEAKNQLKQAMLDNALLKDVSDNDPAGIKEVRLELKNSAYLLGLDLRTIMAQVRSGFFGAQALRFQRGQDEIRVWVRYDRENRSSLADLDEMRISTPSGGLVPLREIATYEIVRGEVAINHLDGQREIQINADLDNPDTTTATEILDWIKTDVMPDISARYPTVTPSYEGQNREAGKLVDSLRLVGLTALFLIFVVISFTFRSFSQPLLLLMLVPFSITAVAWGHKIHGFPLNILSLLGIIALIGIMVNDGLVLIGKYNTNLKTGMKLEKALFEAGRSRFRAIFLTSITTIAGLAPLLLEKSRQAQFLKPMAIAIAYGIGYATILTLVMLPIFLLFGNRIKLAIHYLRTGERIAPRLAERAVKEHLQDEV